MKLHERLKQAREESGLTQVQAAERLGVTNVYLCYVEAGTHEPSLKLLRTMAKTYRVRWQVIRDLIPAEPAGE